MRAILELVVDADGRGATIYDYLRRTAGVSRGLLRRLKTDGCITCNGQEARLRSVLAPGDCLVLYLADEPSQGVIPEPGSLEILYEDHHLLIVNKPAGMVTHPVRETVRGTLANRVAAHLAGAGVAVRPVHRLDRDTSGAVLFAKSPYAHQNCARQRSQGGFHRLYLAVLAGRLPARWGTIDRPVARLSSHPVRRTTRADGAVDARPSLTTFRTLRRWKGATLVAVRPETGRTHQIRVHFSDLGFPLLGDVLYGASPTNLIGRQALHAFRLSFRHPVTGQPLLVQAPLQPDFISLLSHLE